MKFIIIFAISMNLYSQVFSVEGIRIGESFVKIQKKYDKKITVSRTKGSSDCRTCGICVFNLNIPDYKDFELEVDMASKKIVAIFAKKNTDSISSGVISILNTYGKADKTVCYAEDGNTELSCSNSEINSAWFNWTDKGSYPTDTGNYGDYVLLGGYVNISIANHGIFIKSPIISISVINNEERVLSSVCNK